MFPLVVFAAIGTLVAWAARPKKTGVSGSAMGYDHALIPSTPPPRALMPEHERLLSLLVLFAKDKKHASGHKRFLTLNMAKEAVRLSNAMGLPKTATAIKKDGAVPDDEFLRGRSESIRSLVVKYGTTGKA